MHQTVIVSFGGGRQFEYKLAAEDLAGRPREDARAWFDEQFAALECDIETPIGKVLLADRILAVAKYAGEKYFDEKPDWARQFSENAAVLMRHAVLKVDVAGNAVSY
jgi:hypothetical protein